MRSGENDVLLQFGTPKPLHLPGASACIKQNLGYFRKNNGQKGNLCCKFSHGFASRGGDPLGEVVPPERGRGRSLQATLTLSPRLEGSRQPRHAESRRINNGTWSASRGNTPQWEAGARELRGCPSPEHSGHRGGRPADSEHGEDGQRCILMSASQVDLINPMNL